MHFQPLFALAGLAILVKALVIPTGLEDGVYYIRVDENGTEYHELAQRTLPGTVFENALDISAREIEARELEARANFVVWEYKCNCGSKMSPSTCNAAVDGMANWLTANGDFATGGGVFVISGGVGGTVAFVCNNYAVQKKYHMSGPTYRDFVANHITGRCGQWTAGAINDIWREGATYYDSAHVGYAVYTGGEGNEVCARALTGCCTSC